MKTDIEIAQSIELKPIVDVVRNLVFLTTIWSCRKVQAKLSSIKLQLRAIQSVN